VTVLRLRSPAWPLPGGPCRHQSLLLTAILRSVARSGRLAALIFGMVGAMAVDGRIHAEPVHVLRSPRADPAVTVTAPYASFVREAAQRFSMPPSWISAVMAIESGGEVRARSSKGAMGLMQIMPDTWSGLRARHGLGANPYDPRDNILAGAAYLREMIDRFGSPGFIAAYNAGPGSYENHLATGRPLPPETRHYVATLAPLIGQGWAGDLVTTNRRTMSLQDSPLIVRGRLGNSNAETSPANTPAGSQAVARATALVAGDTVVILRGVSRRSP